MQDILPLLLHTHICDSHCQSARTSALSVHSAATAQVHAVFSAALQEFDKSSPAMCQVGLLM